MSPDHWAQVWYGLAGIGVGVAIQMLTFILRGRP